MSPVADEMDREQVKLPHFAGEYPEASIDLALMMRDHGFLAFVSPGFPPDGCLVYLSAHEIDFFLRHYESQTNG